MEAVVAGFIALWVLGRSNLSTSRRIKVEINNPYDQKTAGGVGANGQIMQPTYGKIKVFFTAPESKMCKSIGKTDDGQIRFYVYKIADSNQRVNITVPAGEIGAGQKFNRANWFQSNSGEGYYVIRQRLKTWNGSPYPVNYPASYQQFGLKNYFYETAQRYQRYDDEEAAIQSAQQILEAYNNATGDTGGTPSLPPPIDPNPKPEAPPLEPKPTPPTFPDYPTPPLDPNPNPRPLPPSGGYGDTVGDLDTIPTLTATSMPVQDNPNFENPVSYDGMDFETVSTFRLIETEALVPMKKRRYETVNDQMFESERRGEEKPPEEEKPHEEGRSMDSYKEEYYGFAGEEASAEGFESWYAENYGGG